jgi:hypothetical protein
MDTLAEALQYVHGAHKKFYLTLNILSYDDELDDLAKTAADAWAMGIDGALVSDPGALSVIWERVPGLPLHVSTQANVMNAKTAALFARLGAQRIVLSRELSLQRIQALRAALPEGSPLGRTGGDEFTCIFQVREDFSADDFKRRLSELCRVHNEESGKPWYEELSVGCQEFSYEQSDDITEHFRQADAALYKAKAHRRSSVVRQEKKP